MSPDGNSQDYFQLIQLSLMTRTVLVGNVRPGKSWVMDGFGLERRQGGGKLSFAMIQSHGFTLTLSAIPLVK